MEMTKERAIEVLRARNIRLLKDIQGLFLLSKKCKHGKYTFIVDSLIEEYRAIELAIIALIALPETTEPVTDTNVYVTVNVTTERG